MTAIKNLGSRLGCLLLLTVLAACSPSGDSETQLLPVATPSTVGLSQAGAESAIVGAGLAVGNVVIETSDTVPEGSVISQDPPAGTELPQGSSVDLVVSGGPSDIPVPTTIGLTQAEAEAALTAAGFVIGNITSEASDTIPVGSVVRTNPAPDEAIAPGSTVDLVVSVGPNNTAVPNVAGLSEAAARQAIIDAGLTVGDVTGEADDNVPAGDAIRTDPLVGTLIPAGAPVDLVISQGPANIAVPDVTNLPSADATQALADVGLVVGETTQVVDVNVAVGGVVSQDPEAGTLVPNGAAIDLVISLGPDGVPVPDIVGLQQTSAESVVTTAGLTVGVISTRVDNVIPEGEVISQSLAPGAEVAPGTTLDFLVSLGAPAIVPDVTGLSESDAATTLEAARLAVGNVSTQPDLNVPAGAVISQNPTAGTTVDPGTTVDLVISSGPPTTVTPGVIGLGQVAAEQAILNAELIVGTVTTQPSNTAPAGQVIGQSPAAGAVQVVGSPVDLTVSSGPPQVNVPNVVGLTEAAAGTALTGAGLTVGTVTQQTSATAPIGQVISQTPIAGVAVDAGSPVNLVVSSGPATVNVPNVIGLSQGAAENTITSSNLTVGGISTQASNSVANGNVISQNPSAGTNVSEGSSVSLVVSSGPASVSVPNVVGQSQAAAEAAITGANLAVGAVSNATSNSVASGDVISQSPAAGTNVAEGSSVDLVVSTGPATSTFSDEFSSDTLSEWSLRHVVEGSAAQYTTLDIDTTVAGRLVIVPTRTPGWFGGDDAPLIFKELTGNFAVQTRVLARSIGSATTPPAGEFNSAGLMARDPSGATGPENYVMVNIGRQDDRAGASQIGSEAKNTTNSTSQLTIDSGAFEGDLILCRVGNEVVAFRRLVGDADWIEINRYTRADFPATMQVGMIANAFSTPVDLRAEFDYVRELPTPTDIAGCTP
ncbi:MAG: PASTA domain-containing protein [Pseudomonadota bacterium]